MSDNNRTTATNVACLFSALLLGTFLFISVRIGQQMPLDAVHIISLVLLGLICYVIGAAFLATLLGATLFDRFTTQSGHEYEQV